MTLRRTAYRALFVFIATGQVALAVAPFVTMIHSATNFPLLLVITVPMALGAPYVAWVAGKMAWRDLWAAD